MLKQCCSVAPLHFYSFHLPENNCVADSLSHALPLPLVPCRAHAPVPCARSRARAERFRRCRARPVFGPLLFIKLCIQYA